MRTLVAGVLSVIVGSSIIGVAVFLGLCHQAEAQANAPAQAAVESAGLKHPVPSAAMADTRLAAEVRAFMEAHRSEFVQACVAGTAASVNLDLRFIFNGQGELISYGVNDPPERALQGVARCMRRHRPALSVKPTGRSATVRFTMAFSQE